MSVTITQVIDALEELAPLSFQDDFDNAGLQVGIKDKDVTGVLVCLDITEAVIDEAAALGCNLVVSHHPLIFHPLRQVSDSTYQQRCVMKAISGGITLYSAHTNLDNAEGGVNSRIASMIGLEDVDFLDPKPAAGGRQCGSGVIGRLSVPEEPAEFIARIKELFNVECVCHSDIPSGKISKVALCGGAGSFLMDEARRRGADCFITGEISYHHYFDADGMLLMALGHYQSEQFTQNLLKEYVQSRFPELNVIITKLNTNPIRYSV